MELTLVMAISVTKWMDKLTSNYQFFVTNYHLGP